MKLLIVLMTVWLGIASAAEPQRNLTVDKSGAAENRVALVIGNAAYKSGPLVNPVNDARAMAKRLRSLGFDVVLRENLKQREIGGVYREFRSKITPGGVALVFYAGHGIQFKGQNYFPATDADISSEEDVPLQSLNLGNLLDNMEEAKAGVSLVFLDACRDNPFARRFRSSSRGLAKVEAASGTLIHYATRPGSVASDGDGQNGTYTEALLALMSEPSVPVELMLKRVANNVVAKTKGKQEPWVEGSLRGDFYFRPVAGGTSGAVPQPAVPVDLTTVEISFWESIKSSTDAEDYQSYLNRFPNGQFVELAERRMKKKPAMVNDAASSATPTSVTIIKDCVGCPEMVPIPGKNIAIGKTEVTQGQWRIVMQSDPPELKFKGCDDCPVENVNWNDAQDFIGKLNLKTGKNYRLPSESEWEYACRAGGRNEYCGSDNADSVAWHSGNSGQRTHSVGGKQANAWGLYDMSGNVWEFTQDCWEGNCEQRVLRGGSWDYSPQFAQTIVRTTGGPVGGRRYSGNGFRLARMLDQEPMQPIGATQRVAAEPERQGTARGPEWAESDNGYAINWSEAKQYCKSMGRGWRLPSVSELLSTYQSGQETPCASWTCKITSKSLLTSPWFWTNEQRSSSAAWAIILTSGNRSAAPVENPGALRALCVRDL
jgi:uncharacterized caspase-like protein